MPLRICYDTAAGLAAWGNYKNGGTWNTVLRADPENIANSIEESITWWPPGQYLPLGLLNSAGLSIGAAALAIVFLSTLSLGIGGAILVNELSRGEGRRDLRILPWVAAVFSCSYYALINFSEFSGGETGLMAVLPWIVLVAYKLRHRNLLLVLILPLLFLLGSFIKHSFAIHSICILSFIWLEKSRETLNYEDKKRETLKKLLRIVPHLLAIGIIYIGLRHYFIDTAITPLSVNSPLFSFSTYLGYSAWAPLMAPWGIGSLTNRFAPRLFELNGIRIWEYLGPILSILSPLAIGFYTWLSFRKTPLIRLAGITALLTSLIHFFLYHSGGSINLIDRYYQFPAFLLLAVAATYIHRSDWKMRTARFVLGGSILIGAANVVQLGFAAQSWAVTNLKMRISSGIPDVVVQKIYTLSAESEDCVMAISSPNLEIALSFSQPLSGRFLAMYEDGTGAKESFHGRAPLIVIVHPKTSEHLEEDYTVRFLDYSKDEWESHEVEDWIFLKTKSS